jgi:hypothetical protein
MGGIVTRRRDYLRLHLHCPSRTSSRPASTGGSQALMTNLVIGRIIAREI